MFSVLLRRYHTWRLAINHRNLVIKNGTLLNAFYKSKTIFIHIPKTAGVSLVKAIYGDVTLSGHRSFYFNSIVLKTNKEKYFSFSFIRNPFDRLYSTYMFLSKGGMNNHDRLAFENHLSKFKDFEDFVLNGLDRKIIYKIIHLIPQHQYLCDKKDRILVDFIGRFENLHKDVELLGKALGKEINLEHYNYNKKKHYKQSYSEAMIKKVNRIYKKDIDIFGYSFI